MIYPSGTRVSHSRAHKAAPRVLATGQGDVSSPRPRAKTKSKSEKEWAPIRGGLPKYGTVRPRLPSIDRHRPEPVKGKPALDGTRPTRATRRTQPARTATTAPNGHPAAAPPRRPQNPRPDGPPQSAQSGISQERPENETDISAQTVPKETSDSGRPGFRNNTTSSLHGH